MWGPTAVSVSVCGPLLFLMCVNDITEYFIQNVFLLYDNLMMTQTCLMNLKSELSRILKTTNYEF